MMEGEGGNKNSHKIISNNDADRHHKKKKIRRSDSNSSSSTIQSQIMAMKQYERMGSGSNSSRSKIFSDDSSDEDGANAQNIFGSKTKVNGSKKRRRLTIDSSSSSDGDNDTRRGVSSKKHRKKIRPKVKVVAAPKRKQGFDSSGAIFSKRNLKPVLKVGDKVYAAWWEDEESRRTNTNSSWYEGRINAVKEVNKGVCDYGPVRFYDIEYDDGECVLY